MAESNQSDLNITMNELFNLNILSISKEENLENIAFLKLHLEQYDIKALESKINLAHENLEEFCKKMKLKINLISEKQVEKVRENYLEIVNDIQCGKGLVINKDEIDNILVRYKSNEPLSKETRNFLYSDFNKSDDKDTERRKFYDKIEQAENTSLKDVNIYEKICAKSSVNYLNKKSILLAKLANLDNDRIKLLESLQIEKIKDANDESVDKKLKELFDLKSNLDNLTIEIDYFSFYNDKIELKFDKNNLCYVYHNHLIEFSFNNKVSLAPYFEKCNVKLERSFNKRVYFIALPNGKLVFVQFENGSNHSSVLVYDPAKDNCISKLIKLKYIFKLRNINDLIVINGFDNSDRKLIIVLNDNLELVNKKAYEYDELLCLTKDKAFFHEKSIPSAFKIMKNYSSDNPSIKLINLQNKKIDGPFYMDYKEFYNFIQFEYKEERYFIRAYADNDIEQYIFIYNKKGDLIDKVEVNGHFEVNSSDLIVLEGEYLLIYDLDGKPKAQYEILRNNENYQQCPSLSFSIVDDVFNKIYFFDGLNIFFNE